MNRLNLILDLSNLFYRSLYSSNGFGSFCSYNEQEEINNFIRKLSMDICYVLRIFKPKTVIFAIDDHPWRKELLKDIHDSSLGYKGQRVKNDKMNWDNIFHSLNDFIKILSKNGFIVTKINSAEADDICALWKEYLIPKNESCVIVSSDADIRQLISYDNENFCLVFNPIGTGKGGAKKLFCDSKFIDWLYTNNEVDIFFSNFDARKNFFKNITDLDKKIKIEQIVPENIVLEKIFCGDDGDNIPSFYEYYDNAGKKQRVTPGKSKKIFETLSITSTMDLDSKIPFLKETLETIFKRKLNDIDIEQRLNRQRKLVELKSNFFPSEIMDEFNLIKDNFDKYNYVDVSNYKLTNLLKGTKYLEQGRNYNKPKESAIFKDLDKIIDKGFGGLF